jgi:alkylation response protein AidB-like acyl-CoA dehydrogenase
MDFALDAELQRGARRFLEEVSSPSRVRAAMALGQGFDQTVWARIGSELGWSSLTIPEQYGGAGAGPIELAALMEEMGRALLCAPFFSTVCLVANALLTGGSEAQKRELLPGIAAGETIAALAFLESDGRRDARSVRATARRDGETFVLDGEKRFVLDGGAASLLVIVARLEGTAGEEGICLFALPAETPGIARRALPTMDQTRRQAAVTLSSVRAPAAALIGEVGGGFAILERTLDLAAAALAAEQVGAAQRCLEMAVDYAKSRVQFGRPIGSFQAIKHRCADLLVAVESARSASLQAAWAAASAPGELAAASSLAKAWCSDALFQCAAENVQIHGGIGFTWEHDAHLYLKRARSSESLLGDAAWHRERFARVIGL